MSLPWKKKLLMSRWHADRERLNHQNFQHYFFDLISQSAHVAALDAFAVSARLPAQLSQVLASWDDLSRNFRSLFDRANPEAVVDCELFLALLCPEDPFSKAVLSTAADRYADILEPRLTRPRELLVNIDSLVQKIRAMATGAPNIMMPTGVQLGTALASTCREFSESVSSLRSLGDVSRAGLTHE
jgi:hypothetical protein